MTDDLENFELDQVAADRAAEAAAEEIVERAAEESDGLEVASGYWQELGDLKSRLAELETYQRNHGQHLGGVLTATPWGWPLRRWVAWVTSKLGHSVRGEAPEPGTLPGLQALLRRVEALEEIQEYGDFEPRHPEEEKRLAAEAAAEMAALSREVREEVIRSHDHDPVDDATPPGPPARQRFGQRLRDYARLAEPLHSDYESGLRRVADAIDADAEELRDVVLGMRGHLQRKIEEAVEALAYPELPDGEGDGRTVVWTTPLRAALAEIFGERPATPVDKRRADLKSAYAEGVDK